MAYHNEFGKKGEEIAVNFLINKGLKILQRNWRFKHYEIDIIAETKDEIVFVEVKTRRNNLQDFNQILTKSKKKRLLDAANQYVIENEIDKDVRFDLIFIEKQGIKWKIEHIEDAFNAIL